MLSHRTAARNDLELTTQRFQIGRAGVSACSHDSWRHRLDAAGTTAKRALRSTEAACNGRKGLRLMLPELSRHATFEFFAGWIAQKHDGCSGLRAPRPYPFWTLGPITHKRWYLVPLAESDPEGPSSQYFRTLVPKTIPVMVFGTKCLTCWVLGSFGYQRIPAFGSEVVRQPEPSSGLLLRNLV